MLGIGDGNRRSHGLAQQARVVMRHARGSRPSTLPPHQSILTLLNSESEDFPHFYLKSEIGLTLEWAHPIFNHMVKFNNAARPAFEELDPLAMDRTFAALADPTRRAIIARMADPATSDDGISVGELAEPFRDEMSLPAVSKHLRVLERAGLLRQQKNGRVRRCHLEAQPLQQAHRWVGHYQRYWSRNLDALADFLENQADSSAPKPSRK